MERRVICGKKVECAQEKGQERLEVVTQRIILSKGRMEQIRLLKSWGCQLLYEMTMNDNLLLSVDSEKL